jgi:hypothetical protein
MQRPPVAVLILLAVFVLAVWQAMASLAFLFLCGLYPEYEFPDRLWMFARYFWELRDNAVVQRNLAMPFVLLLAVVLTKRSKGPRSETNVYGKSEFASPAQMKANKITSSKRPF